ncbi:hypothetical protein BDQ12DRAFT_773769 [Crucibulum laeve]|uniref:Integral membrane protein n=1 Tax=Crucibulum laeve TaxID=68775 RepID=A0A5C3M2V8_9AGAR|nr:hypothetical protein BDQ12DRAFT_773769 [Crucibulum laeve]
MTTSSEVAIACRIGLTVSHVVAISSTLYRLYDRKRLHRLWWDDYAALVASFFDCVVFVTMWSRVAEEHIAVSVLIPLRWIQMLSLTMAIWCPRISLALSISRPVLMTRLTVALPFLFAFFAVVGLLQQSIVCGKNTAWYHAPPFVCQVSRSGSFIALACDIIADLALIIIPLRMFWGVSLPCLQHRLILCGFAASCFTVIVSIICVIFVLGKLHLGETQGLIGGAVSLIACNFLIIITSFYRMGRDTGSSTTETAKELSQALQTPNIEPTNSSYSRTIQTSRVTLTEISGSFNTTTASRVPSSRPATIDTSFAYSYSDQC